MTGWLRRQFEGDAPEDITRASGVSAEAIAAGAETAAVGEQVGAGLEAGEQQRAIDYLRQREQLPIDIRDEALGGLRGYYQVPDQQLSQDELIQQAMGSPLYRSILGGRRAGEEGLLRARSATGGLRSGGSQKDIYDYNVELENRALLTSYNEAQQRQDYERMINLQGMEWLAGQTGNENEIARMMAARGFTIGEGERRSAMFRGQGTTGAGLERGAGIFGRAQTQSAARGNVWDTIIGGGQAAATYFSDIRLKDDIRFMGTSKGFNFYGWTWNERAKELGLEGECSGVMAHEVYETSPEAITVKDDFIQVNYSKIGVLH